MTMADGIARVTARGSESSTILGRLPQNLAESEDEVVRSYARRIFALMNESLRLYALFQAELEGIAGDKALSAFGQAGKRQKFLREFEDEHAKLVAAAPLDSMGLDARSAETEAHQSLPRPVDAADLLSSQRLFDTLKAASSPAAARLDVIRRVTARDYGFARDLFATATPSMRAQSPRDVVPAEWPGLLEYAVEQIGISENDPEFPKTVRNAALEAFAPDAYRRFVALRVLAVVYARFANSIIKPARQSVGETVEPPVLVKLDPKIEWPELSAVDDF